MNKKFYFTESSGCFDFDCFLETNLSAFGISSITDQHPELINEKRDFCEWFLENGNGYEIYCAHNFLND